MVATSFLKSALVSECTPVLCAFKNNTDVSDNDSSVSSNINNELYNIGEWLAANKLSLNASKTKYMLFHFPQRNVSNIELTLKIEDHPIERVSDFNVLGTTITQTLDWSHHIDNISNNVSQIIGIINKLKKRPSKIHTTDNVQFFNCATLQLLYLTMGFQYKKTFYFTEKSNSHHYM